MSDAERKKQVDDDILKCKADVLRARDIIPGGAKADKKLADRPAPEKQETRRAQKPQKSTQDQSRKEGSNEVAPVVEPAEAEQQEAEIPQFDLAEDILAEQRKIAAVRRKKPGEKTESNVQAPQSEPARATDQQSSPGPPEPDPLITEMVARDIERLCRGNSGS